MTKRWGSPTITFRIPQELKDQVEQEVERSITGRHDEPWTVSSFIVDAIREFFRHRDRAKKQRQQQKRRRQESDSSNQVQKECQE